MDVGSLGKARIITELISNGFDVYTEFDGKSPFDLAVHRWGKLFRVECKTTKTRNKQNNAWIVQLKRVRPNRTYNKIEPFDKSQCDFVIVYIEPIDKVKILRSRDITVKTELRIFDEEVDDNPWIKHQHNIDQMDRRSKRSKEARLQ